MEIKTISNNVNVFGHVVVDFPNGVAKAFDEMVNTVPGGFDRPYYGLSRVNNGRMEYIAAAEERKPGEGLSHGYKEFVIEEGEYLAEPISGWKSKIHCIKDVFEQLCVSPKADLQKPCVEWYVNDEIMWCMVKCKQSRI